jgi:hypothetical protein
MKLHPRAIVRMRERGASPAEVELTITAGERFPAKFGRQGFRRNFGFDGLWRGWRYHIKQIEVFAAWEDDDSLVISVLVKYL